VGTGLAVSDGWGTDDRYGTGAGGEVLPPPARDLIGWVVVASVMGIILLGVVALGAFALGSRSQPPPPPEPLAATAEEPTEAPPTEEVTEQATEEATEEATDEATEEATEETTEEATEEAIVGPLEHDARTLAATFGDAIWKVEAEGCGMAFSGTAFAVDEYRLVTNWHVTAVDAAPVLVSRDGATRLQARVLGWSERPDVALLEVDEPLDDRLDWADTDDLELGQDLVVLGYPLPAGDFTVTRATIMSFQVTGSLREAIRADGLLDKGNSGGPALTGSGQVAGVATEMLWTGGFQRIPMLYTFDHLAASLAAFERDGAGVTVDCATAGLPGLLPDEWADDWEDWLPARPDAAWTYGDDPELDGLWDACEDGDLEACNELYWRSPVGSEYEAYGATCGRSGTGWGSCADELEPFPWPDDVPSSSATYGEDPELDGLWDACEAGDLAACDELYLVGPYGSDYETFGSTCGERRSPMYGTCGWEIEDPWADPDVVGGEPELSWLRTACESGDLGACDDLYWFSPFGSDDEAFGSTCGNRREPTSGNCADG
jgi:S1-C subfamily serine protease